MASQLHSKTRYKFGEWLSLARALALGARGREFKSHLPDIAIVKEGVNL